MHQVLSPETAINTIRFLAVDMVERARSGHPGAPMGQAPLAYLLWTRYLRFDPGDPGWPNRDRFVLSCGHASALLYALLHLAGFDLDLEQLRRFRQLGSKTPGHPEHGLTPGVETTTGPLGQGLANAVGMAIAERLLAQRFNRPDYPIFDHRIWVLASDGDLMEGVSAEACSLAGHLALGKLLVFYDSNRITIDGATSLAFSEDVSGRFAAYGWHTQTVEDGNDLEALAEAAEAASAESARPSIVLVRTHIGYGSPAKQDTAGVHGSPLGEDEVRATKEHLGWPLAPELHVPDEARVPFEEAAMRGREEHRAWRRLLAAYREAHPEAALELDRRSSRSLPEGWEALLPEFSSDGGPIATRSVSGKVLNAVAPALPELVGGSADLSGSNNTLIEGEADFAPREPGGRNLRFGVREHGMAAVLSGIALSGLFRPYGGTFLIFSDYMRAAVRLAALMELPVVYVLTHDSIFLGEDGPTHQPVSQLASLRAIPGLVVLRPADARETVAAWKVALERRAGPTVLALTRQKVATLEVTGEGAAASGVPRGGYVVRDAQEAPEAILIATGSELSLALGAQEILAAEGRAVRVVSLPSWELFAGQPRDYRERVLPPAVHCRLAVEAGSSFGWERWVGSEGSTLTQDDFGASAPHRDLAAHFGFTVEAVAARLREMIA